MLNMNFHVLDVPLWYSSPIGPSVNLALSYNSQSSITYHEPFGNKWQFNYASYLVVDPSGTVTIFMPDGAVDSYFVDGSGGYTSPYRRFGKLTKIAENHFQLKFPDDTVHVYAIPTGTASMQPFLTELRDSYGQKLTFGYNANVQLATITDAVGKVTTLTYNPQGLVTQATDPFGRIALFEYDAAKNLVAITDMGGYKTELGYDADVYMTSMKNPLGEWKFATEPADGINNNLNIYPAPGDIMWANYRITVTNPLGDKQEYYYDGYHGKSWVISPRNYVPYVDSSTNNYQSAAKTNYTFTKVGQDSEINYIASPEGSEVTFGYDAAGNRISIRDANYNTTALGYNERGQVTSITRPKGEVQEFVYAANGIDVLEIKNGLGRVVSQYNDRHGLIALQDRTGNPPWTFAYNSYGQMVSATDPIGVMTEYLYNAAHQLTQIKKAGSVIDTFSYDTIGRLRSRTDATGLTVQYSYNGLNHLTRISYPDGKNVDYTYADCCPRLIEQVTDRAGRSTVFQYDALKRLVQTTDPAGLATNFIYDQDGNLAALIDAAGNSTGFQYDGNDRLIEKIYADGKTVKFTYDAGGRLKTRINGRTLTSSYGYDTNDNLLNINYSDSTPDVAYTYDVYDRLIRRVDGTGTTLLSYDSDSRLLGVDGPWSDDTITYRYDELGRRVGLAIQGGSDLVYDYDILGRLAKLKVGGDSYEYSYSGVSPLVSSLLRPNGSKTIYQYDTLNRLNLLSHRSSTNAILREFGYTYNAQDLRDAETRVDGDPALAVGSGLTLYENNTLNQLLRSVSPERLFTYDNDGNMTQGYTPEGYRFQAAYDAENRLKTLEFTGSGGTVFKYDYGYGAGGALATVKRSENSTPVAESRLVGEGFLPLQERNGSNGINRQYTWGLDIGGGIGGLLQLQQGGQDYSYLYDGRGNVSALLNSSQMVAGAYNYDAYGNTLAKSGIVEQPFRFSTKGYEEKTGLSYYGYRYYSPGLGRWLTRDPLGEGGGANLYGYDQGNPISLIDPDGRSPVIIFGAIAGGISGYIAAAESGADLLTTLGSVATGAAVGAVAPWLALKVGGGAAAAFITSTVFDVVGAGVSTAGINLLKGKPWDDELGRDLAITTMVSFIPGTKSMTKMKGLFEWIYEGHVSMINLGFSETIKFMLKKQNKPNMCPVRTLPYSDFGDRNLPFPSFG